MGEYRYAIVELPPSPYAHDLQEVLAFVFDIGVNLAGCTGEQVAQAFMASGLAEEFESKIRYTWRASRPMTCCASCYPCFRATRCPHRNFATTGRRTSGPGGRSRSTR